MDQNLDHRLKRLRYDGSNPPDSSAEIVYMVSGKDVIFSAVENVVRRTSTISAAEEIVHRICEAEGLDWRECVFYDMQTWIGYPHHDVGYLCIDELVFAESANMHVESWRNRVRSAENQDFLGGLPQEILKMLGSGQ